MKKYKLNKVGGFSYIQDVDIIKETASTVTKASGLKECKDTNYHTYFETKEEAFDEGVKYIEAHVSSLEKKVTIAKEALDKFKKDNK